MGPSRSTLWYLTAGTRGGPNRMRILRCLREHPYNAHQLAEALRLDYRTVRHHLRLLEENHLVYRPVVAGYAAPYEIAPHLRELEELWRPEGSGSAIDRPRTTALRRAVD